MQEDEVNYIRNGELPSSHTLQDKWNAASQVYILQAGEEKIFIWEIWPAQKERPKDTDLVGSTRKQPSRFTPGSQGSGQVLGTSLLNVQITTARHWRKASDVIEIKTNGAGGGLEEKPWKEEKIKQKKP